MLSAGQRTAIARGLWDAEAGGVPVPPLTETWPGIDVVDAYEIQLANVRRRVAAGASVVGHKVGLSSEAMQVMMGVDEPDYGHLLSDMVVVDASTAPTGRLLRPRVEVEVAFVLGHALSGPGCSAADVVAATDFVAPAIEIIDSRIRDWKIRLEDTIADNASSAGVVLGPERVRPGALDLAAIDAVLYRNGEELDRGSSGAVLGNPVTAVAWLANTVCAYGVKLEAGHVVLPGSCTRAHDVGPGDHVEATFAGLGRVRVDF